MLLLFALFAVLELFYVSCITDDSTDSVCYCVDALYLTVGGFHLSSRFICPLCLSLSTVNMLPETIIGKIVVVTVFLPHVNQM